jgi:3-hydroxyacyl-CoA dehydrogenase/enoyl-CoA hydratase/3-hydroxybutyryl-CoA epimerase
MPLPKTFDKLLAQKRLGKKTGSGFYIYSEDKKDKELDPNIYTILGITHRSEKILNEDIIDRCVLAMVNEAARCLEESVVSDAATVDLGMIMGTGFPPLRGGLLRYAESVGLDKVIARLEALAKTYGKRFEPSPALKGFAKKGSFFG